MSAREKYLEADKARLRRILDNPATSEAGRAMALEELGRLEPKCKYCELTLSAHRGAKCAVLARFQQRHGRGTMPTDGQAAEIRRKMADDEAANGKAERAKENRGRQGRLFE